MKYEYFKYTCDKLKCAKKVRANISLLEINGTYTTVQNVGVRLKKIIINYSAK